MHGESSADIDGTMAHDAQAHATGALTSLTPGFAIVGNFQDQALRLAADGNDDEPGFAVLDAIARGSQLRGHGEKAAQEMIEQGLAILALAREDLPKMRKLDIKKAMLVVEKDIQKNY